MQSYLQTTQKSKRAAEIFSAARLNGVQYYPKKFIPLPPVPQP